MKPQIVTAGTAGYCFGVNRAVELVEQAAREGKRAVTLGPIIHNRHAVAYFEGLGIRAVDSLDEITDDHTAVIIRSHGVSRAVYEELERRGLEIIDATCPFVKRIHRIVSRSQEEGRQIVIIGTRSHPEVEAIAGWCENAVVVENSQELEKLLERNDTFRYLPISVVMQTTSTKKNWETCSEIIKKICTNHILFDTICEATEKRQAEASQLAQQCDAMIVVGDSKSANTGRLAAICRQYCGQVVMVDNASDLNPSDFQGAARIGITAGASTPAWIIKEVNKTMSEIINVETVPEESIVPEETAVAEEAVAVVEEAAAAPEEAAVAEEAAVPEGSAASEDSFEALLEQSIKTLNTGDKVLGTVVAIGSTEVQVDLGTKHAGYIPADEVSTDPNERPEDVLKIGDEIEVFVVRVNDAEGTVQLSKKKLDGMKVWDDIEALCESREVVEGVITEENKGGVVANIKGIRVFIPASQSGIARGGELSALKGKTVKMKITEVNRARRRVVGSIRAVNAELRRAAIEKIWSEIEVGKKYQGVVKSLTSYGAFVDIGGVDGMVHVSELSWRRIKSPAEVVKVGDQIEVFVISFDPEKRKISLGYKTPEMNPWNQFMSRFNVGDVTTVKVVKLMTFGAFAEIIPGVDGLIHISQIADRRIDKPEDVLSEGQEVEAKIIDIDAENKRISLSIRALLTAPVQTAPEADAVVYQDEPEEAPEEAPEAAPEEAPVEAVDAAVEEAPAE